MKKLLAAALAMMISISMMASTKKHQTAILSFDSTKSEECSITSPLGQEVKFTAYTNLYYVTNIEDSTYQYLNVFVPKG